jgi:pullulanase/glycogen debranching enzyme
MDSETKQRTHLNWAAWTSMQSGVVSFSRDWEDRKKPELWWGEDHLKLKGLTRLSPEDFGLHGGYYGRRDRIYFVLPKSVTEGMDLGSGLYVAGSFNGWQEAIGDRRWRMRDGHVRGEPCHVLSIRQTDLDAEESATFKFVTGDEHWIEVPEVARNTHVDGFGIKNYLFSSHRSGRHLFRFQTPLPLNRSEGRLLYFRKGETVESIRLSPGIFLKSLETGARLGANVEGEETVFRLFAPRAARVKLYLFEDRDGPEGEPISMTFTQDLVWVARVPGNRHGWCYYYTVLGQETDEVGYFDPDFRIPDPYARAVCGPLGPGIVVEDAFFEREDDGFEPPRWHDLVITEAHVRDLTAHAPLDLAPEERRGFEGLRKWVDADESYLSELGINAVELQPVHEFDTVDPEQYGWGYMPVNYFSPASQYAPNPARLEQVTGFRDLVRSFHRRKLAVILDVVYNHVGEPNFLQYLDREYYFLLTEDGHYENHSGCGNTLDANTPMVRRLIRDSLVHWIKAYGVDGFRFDLGELIGKETLAWLEGELKAVKPDVILIAEPWSFRGHIGKELRDTGFASWNDGYREFIREYVTHHREAAELRYFVQGSAPDWSRFPAQTVNYVACHDDRCWIDKITENGSHDGTRPTATDRRRTHLMISLLMMSVGIPMINSGVDMLKSKGGVNNTYLRGDLNAIPYLRMTEYSGTVRYFRNWIRFRLGDLGRYLRLDRFPGNGYFVTSEVGKVFGQLVNASRAQGPDRLLFVVNPTYEYEELRFEEADLSGFRQVADTEDWGYPELARPHYPVEEDRVLVPPLSCGLFVESGRASG